MANNLKVMLRNVLGVKFQQKYLALKLRHTKRYKMIKTDANEVRMILLDTPEHGNLGDHTIVLVMRQFIQKYFPDSKLYEFTYKECKYCIDELFQIIKEEDLIFLPGGGFLGTLWPQEEENFLNILNKFEKNTIIVFPQTVFFEDTPAGKSEKKRFFSVLAKCKRLHLFLRDQRSYNLVKSFESNTFQFYLVPDIVTWMRYKNKIFSSAKKRILFCLRDDKEKIADIVGLKDLFQRLSDMGYEVDFTTTVMNYEIYQNMRNSEVLKKLKEFSEAELVITDRLHGMLFSAITSTACIALDNVSGKIYGGYEWIKYLGYIRIARQDEITVSLIEELLAYKSKKYDNRQLRKYYKKIAEIIAKESGLVIN